MAGYQVDAVIIRVGTLEYAKYAFEYQEAPAVPFFTLSFLINNADISAPA